MSRKSTEALSPRYGSIQPANGLHVPLIHNSEVDDNEESPQYLENFPLAAEWLGLARLAVPLVLQNLAGYMLSVVSAVFVGHLNDPVALSSVVLAGSFYNITGYSLVIGLSAGMETLCGQAFGAGNYSMLGLVLQRALLICWTACMPISLLWSQAPRLLALLHQQHDIVLGATRYLSIATPALFLSSVSSCLYRYLVTQQEVRPPMLCTMATAALCPLYNWLLVYRLALGLEGAAWAFLASTGTYAVLLTSYVIVRDWLQYKRNSERQTWSGFSWRALEGWGDYLRFAAPSAAMICMEWWIFELVIFMAGSLGAFAKTAVAVMGISFHITSWALPTPAASNPHPTPTPHVGQDVHDPHVPGHRHQHPGGQHAWGGVSPARPQRRPGGRQRGTAAAARHRGGAVRGAALGGPRLHRRPGNHLQRHPHHARAGRQRCGRRPHRSAGRRAAGRRPPVPGRRTQPGGLLAGGVSAGGGARLPSAAGRSGLLVRIGGGHVAAGSHTVGGYLPLRLEPRGRTGGQAGFGACGTGARRARIGVERTLSGTAEWA